MVCLYRSGCYTIRTHRRNPTTARREHFELLDVSPGPNRTSSDNLATLGSPRVSMLMPSLVRTLVQRDTQSSSHPQSLASHLLGLQGPQQTPACKASSKLEYLNVCCCAPTPGGSNLNHKGVRVHTCVPAFDAKVGTACKA